MDLDKHRTTPITEEEKKEIEIQNNFEIIEDSDKKKATKKITTKRKK